MMVCPKLGLSHTYTVLPSMVLLLQDDKLSRSQVELDVERTVRGLLYRSTTRLAVEKAHLLVLFVERGINNDAVVAVLICDVIRHQHLAAVEHAGEGKGVGGAVREAEVHAIARDLPKIHAAKA